MELLAQKILVVLQCGEMNRKVKLKMDSIIKTVFSEVYEAAKKQNREILKQHYMRMDIRTRKEEARFDAAVYFFLSVHDVCDRVEYQSLLSILCDIEDYELSWKEYEKSMLEKKQIQAVDIPERELFGRKRNKDIEMIMKFHGMEASLLFNEDSWHSNELLLALNIEQDLKDSRYNKEEIVKNLFFYELLGKYQEIRDYVVSRELNQRDIEVKEEYEEKLNQLQEEKCHIEEEKRRVEVEKKRLMDENYGLKEKMKEIDLVYRGEINQLKRQHQLEIMNYQKNIQESVKELRYLKSATKVAETLHSSQNLTVESKFELFNIIEHITLVIIGGSKEWRRKLRERFPNIRFLNGFNENFDEGILEKADLIL
ncbi:MAG: hypothetical protein JW708_02550, partial [Vallitaleaceae bacterium]|nr:hypothetical protein [Vallitaleaceae bacterium]